MYLYFYVFFSEFFFNNLDRLVRIISIIRCCKYICTAPKQQASSYFSQPHGNKQNTSREKSMTELPSKTTTFHLYETPNTLDQRS